MSRTRPDRDGMAREHLRWALESSEFDLIEAVFWVAAEEYPDLDVHREIARIHFIAAEGARRVDLISNPFARLDGLRTFLFEELGFKGNVHDFHDPRNSYMNEVLNRKVGIPLTLSILFMELARAAGFDAIGIGLPGHFVTRVSMDGRDLLVDPYHGGRVITEEDCAKLVKRTTGRPLFRREHLNGVEPRAVVRRMLLNLKHIYVKRGNYQSALSAVDRLLMITPGNLIEVRDRGFLQAHLGRPGAAITDLETYLTGTPRAHDTLSVRGRVVLLRRRLSEMN